MGQWRCPCPWVLMRYYPCAPHPHKTDDCGLFCRFYCQKPLKLLSQKGSLLQENMDRAAHIHCSEKGPKANICPKDCIFISSLHKLGLCIY